MCAACDAELEPPYVWPSDEGDICQMCWEQQCADSFWEYAATGRLP